MNVRSATEGDLPAITALYAWHVLNGTGTFEEVPPEQADMRERWRAVSELGLPWLVALVEGEVAGFAYAGPWKARSAYRYTVEDSVYVANAHRGRGIGRQLLAELIRRCEACGKRQMMSVVGDAGNRGSLALHEALGFQRIGTARDIGLKFGRSLDVVYLQRRLDPGLEQVDK